MKTIFLGLRLLVLLGALPGQAHAQEAVPIRVYTSWPLQGSMQPEGESMLAAARLALQHYLADHGGRGPGGFSIEIIATDDASPTTGSWDGTIEAGNAQRCVNDPLCMVYFGTYNSGAAMVSSPITNQSGITHITPANTYPGLTKAWAEGEPGIYRPSGKVTFFRTNASDDLQGWAGAAWALCRGFSRVYVLDDRQLYGKGIADAFVQRAGEIGLQIVGRSGVEAGDIDFRTLLTNVRATNADLVYGGFVIDSGGPQVIQQMGALGLFRRGVKFMGPDGLVNPALAEQVGGASVIDGNLLLTFPGLTPRQLSTEIGKRFVAGFVAQFGYEPSPWSTYAYQAMQVVLDAIGRAGVADRTAILDAMRSTTNYPAITGNFSFNQDGDPVLTALGGNEVLNGDFIFAGEISPTMNQTCTPGA